MKIDRARELLRRLELMEKRAFYHEKIKKKIEKRKRLLEEKRRRQLRELHKMNVLKRFVTRMDILMDSLFNLRHHSIERMAELYAFLNYHELRRAHMLRDEEVLAELPFARILISRFGEYPCVSTVYAIKATLANAERVLKVYKRAKIMILRGVRLWRESKTASIATIAHGLLLLMLMRKKLPGEAVNSKFISLRAVESLEDFVDIVEDDILGRKSYKLGFILRHPSVILNEFKMMLGMPELKLDIHLCSTYIVPEEFTDEDNINIPLNDKLVRARRWM